MTPKEKAIEIYTKMYNEIYTSYVTDFVAKQCAIIAVDQILEIIYSNYDWEYWLEVKKDIEKL
jgi:hypothetical protein